MTKASPRLQTWSLDDGGEPPRDDAPPIPIELTEDAITLAFTERHRDSLRFVAQWNKWFQWDGSRWVEDRTLDVFEKARSLCRQASRNAETKKEKAQIKSAKTVAAVERLARYDRIHATTASQWDSDPWLLGTPGGTVDLRTGEIRDAVPDEYITKQTAVTPDATMECPQWLGVLHWAMAGDVDMVAFLQRMWGYVLTGITREHALFFPYGTGGNGKGTVVNTVTGIMGDYATVAPMETFTESKSDRHPTDLAMLRGARLVASQETERGRKWAESRVKALTGGDPITARFMRQDFFTFTPEFKLVIAANDKPAIASVDEAIRRRFHLIPFEQHIAPESRDEQLMDKLRGEWPGILAWMIEGTQLWLEQGLRPPEKVQAATEAYLDEQDSFGSWISEACKTGHREWGSTADLYESWATWARRSGEEAGTSKAFSSEMSKRGFTPKKGGGHASLRGFQGISVKQDTENAYKSGNAYQREAWP